jgi:hypothetical protein
METEGSGAWIFDRMILDRMIFRGCIERFKPQINADEHKFRKLR